MRKITHKSTVLTFLRNGVRLMFDGDTWIGIEADPVKRLAVGRGQVAVRYYPVTLRGLAEALNYRPRLVEGYIEEESI
jgi:hypothetical protein